MEKFNNDLFILFEMKFKETLLTLILALSSCSLPDSIGISGELSFPRLSRSERTLDLISKATVKIRTYKDEAKDLEVILPTMELQYYGTRLLEELDHNIFYLRFGYNEGEVNTRYPLSTFSISRDFFTSGIGVKSFLFPIHEKDINFGLDLRADYYSGDWEGKYKTLFGNVSLSGTDRGFGFYGGALIEGKFPDEIDFLKDVKWNLFGGYNYADFGDYSDLRGPVFGLGIRISFPK